MGEYGASATGGLYALGGALLTGSLVRLTLSLTAQRDSGARRRGADVFVSLSAVSVLVLILAVLVSTLPKSPWRGAVALPLLLIALVLPRLLIAALRMLVPAESASADGEQNDT